MTRMFLDRETTREALRDAARTAKTGTREEQSGRFLPPPGWKGEVVRGAPAKRKPRAA